ncbi:IS605 OrfB family transposase [Streptomyces sp. LBL]|nr:IS605 OrfB family transposase [Streptomyces sp. LBL]
MFGLPSVLVMQLRYSFRVYPDAGQRRALARAFGCARVVFNDAVRAREEARAAEQPFPTAAELSKRLITEAKQTVERSWLGEVSAVVLQQSLRDAESAYRNFFASLKGARKGPKVGAPRFKSRKDTRQSIRFTANARWSITDSGRLNLPKIGAVKVKWSRTLPTTPSSVTVIKDAAGRFFASFVIDTDPNADATRMPDTDLTIGIDLGLTHFAVLSDGTKIDSPRFLRRAEKKLKKAQQELSRKQKGSKNREKARLKVARAHAKVTDARREFHHQLSTQLICENQGIAVEDLSVAGLARTRLAKSVHDAGWSSFLGMLQYKAARYGRTLVKIGRFEPTSQTCSTCGVKDGPKPLNVREWTCTAWHRPRPGPQRRDQRQTGRRTGGISLRSAGKTRSNPGTARRNRKPRIPGRTTCRVAAQQRSRRPESSGFSPRSKSILPALSARPARHVVTLPGLQHLVHPALHEVDQAQQTLGDLAAEGGQFVVHPGRVRGLRLAVDQAVALQRVQRLGQHLLAHAVDPAAQLVEAQRALVQGAQGEPAPAPRDVLQGAARRTCLGEHVEREVLRRRALLRGVHESSVRERSANRQIVLTRS